MKNIYTALRVKTSDYTYKDPWVRAVEEDKNLVIEPAGFKKGVVPDVRGMKAKDAVFLLENKGLKTHISGRGFVRTQSVKPGTALTKGRVINLQLVVY